MKAPGGGKKPDATCLVHHEPPCQVALWTSYPAEGESQSANSAPLSPQSVYPPHPPPLLKQLVHLNKLQGVFFVLFCFLI